jgi:hypothetical protein
METINISSTKLPRPWSPQESSPSRKNPHVRPGNRTQDLMISSQKLWPLDHEAGLLVLIYIQQNALIVSLHTLLSHILSTACFGPFCAIIRKKSNTRENICTAVFYITRNGCSCCANIAPDYIYRVWMLIKAWRITLRSVVLIRYVHIKWQHNMIFVFKNLLFLMPNCTNAALWKSNK